MLAWAAIILSPVRIAEERLEDLRMELVAPRPADPRIMLVSLDEATLDDGAANFFERADRLVQGIEGLYKAGVKSVALDLILPRRFSESEALSKLVLMRRQQLVLGLYATQGGQVKGWECLSALTRSVFDSSAELGASFGLVNLEPGADGRIRTFRTQLQATDGSALEPLAVRVYHQVGNRPQMASEVVIDHSVNPANFARAAWNDIPALLAADPEFFRGRLVLLGVDSPLQEDVHAIPSLRGRPGELSGLAIHALILQTLLNGRPIKKEPVWISLLAVMAMGGTCAWYFLREPKAWKAWLLAGGALAAYSFLLLALGSRGFLLPMAGPLVTTLVIIGFAALARQFLPPIPDAESLHAS
jgi:CHASE2 domain-containing sensor protein